MTISHEDRERFKPIAERVAAQLMSDLKEGRLKKIGIDEIRDSLAREPGRRDVKQCDFLEEMTLRRVVEKVG